VIVEDDRASAGISSAPQRHITNANPMNAPIAPQLYTVGKEMDADPFAATSWCGGANRVK
jgi:hypothetical protein